MIFKNSNYTTNIFGFYRVSTKGENLSEDTEFFLPVLEAAVTASTHSCDLPHSPQVKKSLAGDTH